jgi:hypothetical protein
VPRCGRQPQRERLIPVEVKKRTIEGRDFWFTAEHVHKEDPDTGDFSPTGQYYCAFSTSEPGPMIQGEVFKDDRGRAKLFPTAQKAIEAGIQEVKSRLHLPPKAYAVGLPYGNKEKEFDAYVQILQQQGITIEESTRVQDSFGRKWLHVWNDRSEAEQFADRVRNATGNRDWEVYDLSPPPPTAGGQNGRPGPVEILVGRQKDGSTYSLHPSSLKLIRQRFPRVHPRPTVFIGSDTQTSIEASVGSIYNEVAIILSGLGLRQLNEIGGYRVVDPLTDLVLYQSDMAAE